MPSDSSEKILSDVEDFCQELRPNEELCYLEHKFNDQLVPLAKKHGLLGLIVPASLGGRGASGTTYAKALARIGREGTGVRTFFSGHTSIGQYPILRYGNDRQKNHYLPKSTAGEMILAFGLTEPDAGSNPLEMTSTYRREGNQFVLNGVKYLISNGSIAHLVIVFAYPENAEGKSRRISAFVVETGGESFTAESLPSKLGMHSADTGMFQMNEHRIPVENLLGEEGNGFRIAMGTLVSGRLSVAAGCVGVIEDCLTEVLSYAKTRIQHGKPIGKHQLVQDHIAQIELARAAATAIVEKAASAKEASDHLPGDKRLHDEADLIVAEAKFISSRAAWEAADRAVQVFGGRGWSELYRVGRHLQDSRVCRIYEGTDEVLKLKIAERLLGKEYSAFH